MLHRLREAVGKDLDKLRGQEILDRMTDKVLAYRPKPKTRAAKRRARRKRRQLPKRESSI